ncbi:S41 family peptidase [Tautonia marina]|uniref:S41 family peptidase n=1 Tax=Tautonia marina TaxID=2653855 RepID=UPI001260D621|nr:S41 family peptidase [Tautonia marina]
MLRSTRLVFVLGVLGLPIVSGSLWAQEPVAEARSTEAAAEPNAVRLTAEQARLNLESFDIVWETIRDKHFDPNLNGVDWPAVREELRPRMAEAKTMDEARETLQDMVKRLNQSHFGIISRSVYDAIDGEDAQSGGDGSTGLHIRAVEGEALVVLVEPGSPAEASGIKAGWIVDQIEGKPVAPVLEKVAEAYRDSTQLDLYASRVVERRLDGPSGSDRTITFRDGEGEQVERTLTLARPRGTTARFGNLPPMTVYFETRQVDETIPYVHWSAFFDPASLIPRIGEAITGQLDAPGLILDLRGNPGGIGAMAMGICGWLIDESGLKLGTMTTRDTNLNFVVFPRAETFQGPVAVLVDGCSASTSEIFAGGLQDLGRARIFGTRTAGAALPSIVVKLPNGDGFQYAFANYVSASGATLEGIGVIPDEEVWPSREGLLSGGDPVLDAAIEWIRVQNGE